MQIHFEAKLDEFKAKATEDDGTPTVEAKIKGEVLPSDVAKLARMLGGVVVVTIATRQAEFEEEEDQATHTTRFVPDRTAR